MDAVRKAEGQAQVKVPVILRNRTDTFLTLVEIKEKNSFVTTFCGSLVVARKPNVMSTVSRVSVSLNN